MGFVFLHVVLLLPLPLSVHAEDIAKLSANPFNDDSTASPVGGGIPSRPTG
jgi:hypothetical protein